MECLNHKKIQQTIDGDLTRVEKAMVRDHLIVCDRCRQEYEYHERLEQFLQEPVYIKPPEIIERSVMRTLFPRIPSYSSIFALIAASFVFIVTWIYIYFDFANNSLIQAIQMTSESTSNWIGSIVKFISTVFSGVYAVFRVVDALIAVVFNVNVGVEIIGLLTFTFFAALLYFVSRKIFKTARRTEG